MKSISALASAGTLLVVLIPAAIKGGILNLAGKRTGKIGRRAR